MYKNILFFGGGGGKSLQLPSSLPDAHSNKGSSINDVTVVGWRGYQGFCDNSTTASVIKSVTMGGGGS